VRVKWWDHAAGDHGHGSQAGERAAPHQLHQSNYGWVLFGPSSNDRMTT
jgi:hypothetical protein